MRELYDFNRDGIRAWEPANNAGLILEYPNIYFCDVNEYSYSACVELSGNSIGMISFKEGAEKHSSSDFFANIGSITYVFIRLIELVSLVATSVPLNEVMPCPCLWCNICEEKSKSKHFRQIFL